MLTDKREKFVQGLIAGMSQREAYKAAFNASRMKDSTIDTKASELLANGKVRGRYEELQGKVRSASETAAVATAVEVLEELTNLAMGKKEYPSLDMFGNPVQRPVSVSARIKALELMAKHHKLLTDNVNLSGTAPVQIVNDIPKGDSGG